MNTTLIVNGEKLDVVAEPDTPLLYVLRNDLGLKGTLFGCGNGSCGACFVLIGDRAMASCDMSLSAVGDQPITTVEGLARAGLTPLQQAFIDGQAGQCSYCVPGILISATALSRRAEDISEAKLLEAMDRHLCRCGCHNRFTAAIRKVLGLTPTD